MGKDAPIPFGAPEGTLQLYNWNVTAEIVIGAIAAVHSLQGNTLLACFEIAVSVLNGIAAVRLAAHNVKLPGQ